MVWTRIKTLTRLLRRTRNPLPLFIDYVGLKKHPYLMRTRDGEICEIRASSSDRFVFYEVLVRNDYLQQGQIINPGDTVVDIGANIGCFSLLAGKRVGPTGRVIAVEPGEAAYRQLCRNLEWNGLSNVTPVRAAIGRHDGKARLHIHDLSQLSSLYDSVDGHGTGAHTEDVRVMSLETLFSHTGIGFCRYMKVDCEGGEYDLIGTMAASLAARIEQLTLEVHCIPGHQPDELRQRLITLGFQIVPGRLLYGRRGPRYR